MILFGITMRKGIHNSTNMPGIGSLICEIAFQILCILRKHKRSCGVKLMPALYQERSYSQTPCVFSIPTLYCLQSINEHSAKSLLSELVPNQQHLKPKWNNQAISTKVGSQSRILYAILSETWQIQHVQWRQWAHATFINTYNQGRIQDRFSPGCWGWLPSE